MQQQKQASNATVQQQNHITWDTLDLMNKAIIEAVRTLSFDNDASLFSNLIIFAKLFNKADANGDDYIDSDEAYKFLECTKKTVDADIVRVFMAAYDIDLVLYTSVFNTRIKFY